MTYSTSEENYIKAIFHLQTDSDLVSTNALSAALNTKPASTTDMLKKLKKKKLINYQPYKGFNLNNEGIKVALGIIRRHRLWEFFLSEKLNFEWDEVHAVAEDLEHVSSDKLIDKLDQYLGFPKFDPHGDPIPDVNGKMETKTNFSLTEFPLNKSSVVTQVLNQSKEMLDLLSHNNIAIGTKLEIKKRFSFDNSIEIKIGKNPSFTISEQLAKNIFVNHES
jgi:DtxR family transcriptional regulator, Mn-dependent transcriptional regulator